MPDPSQLNVGDRVRIVSVPEADARAARSGGVDADTLRVLTWMVGKEFVVFEVDEFGTPWLDVAGYPDPRGAEHTMAIMDSESWVLVPEAADRAEGGTACDR